LGGISDKEVAVGGKYVGLLLVEMLEFDGGAMDASSVSGCGVFAVNCGVPSFPHEEEFFPDCGDDCRGPE
jgi:hypothetical protein